MKNIKTKGDLKKERGKMKKGFALGFFILLLSVLINISFVLAVNDFDEYKPYLHNPSVGDVPELDTFGEYTTSLFPGSATYSYNIIVPKGVLGLQPSISLAYSSQNMLQSPGVLGAGWSLSENNIIRHVNYTIDDTSDDYFIMSINGNNFKLFFNGSNWNSEFNPRQIRIENLTSNWKQYWLVTTTDGTKYRFGFNNDSLLGSNTGRDYNVKWSLDQAEDVYGNKIFYNYLEDPFNEDEGAVYISNITYNNDKLKLISFSYENEVRPDRRLSYEQGNLIEESRRLKGISVFFNNSLVRRYHLDYSDLNNESSMTSLVNISYMGSDNSSVLNTIKLEYYESNQGFDNTTGKWVILSDFTFSSTDVTKKDFGVRLIDVNNDGFPDLVKAKSGETHKTSLNNKLDGWNDSSSLVIPNGIAIVDSSNIDQGVRFADVDSDGLIDILLSNSSTKKVYLNNGTDWYDQSSNWSIPLDFIDSNSRDLGVRLVDFNGDGRVDMLKGLELSGNEAYINNGTGWENTSEWVVPNYFTNSEYQDTGLRVLDLNNDGLPDLIKGGEPGEAWLNNGTGWESHLEFAPNLKFVDYDNNRPDLGVRFIELNGDGLVDIIQNFFSNVSIINQTCVDQGNSTEECIAGQNITFDTNTKINNGSGWVAGQGWISPERFTDEGFNIGRRIADVNGDGFSDILVVYQGASFENITYIRNSTGAFLLKRVTNAYGGKTGITYKQSTLSDNGDDLGFNIWVVGNTSLNNSLTDEFMAGSDYSYEYSSGMFDYKLKEFRGFGFVNETLPDNSVIFHAFHQDNILQGKEFITSIYDSLGNHIKDSLNYYTYSSDNMIYLNETSSQIYDGISPPFVTNVSFEYDYYGNILGINNLGDIDLSGDEKFEEFNYFYNTSNFIVDKPANYTLFDSDDSTIVKQAYYFYDNQTSGVSLGSLTKVENFNDNGQNPEIQYIYDSFGNIIAQIDDLGYETDYDYDSTGTFRIKETNALGHVISYDYEPGTGNLIYEVRDGLNKSYSYDIFGRLSKESISPDTLLSPTKNYTYNLDGAAPEIIKVQTKNNDNDYSEDIFIYDGFSNPVQVRSLFNPSVQIIKNYFYDSKYRISEEENPYFDGYSIGLSSSINSQKVRYEYDSLDRVINITKQDNNSVIVVFNQTIASQFDENGNQIDYLTDSYGRIIRIMEYNNGEVYVTNYTYRADDILLNITDSQGNDFVFGYDSLGRRILFDDPNMEPWAYSYDANGNLVNQTDGRNITTYLTYDELNRIIFKKAGYSNVSFAYDGQFNGTLTNISTDSDYHNAVFVRYIYDNRLRVSNESIFYCYREKDPGPDDECETVNASTKYDSGNRIINMYFPNTNFQYEYNPIGKIESIGGFLDSVNYNAFGKVSNKTYNNNIITQVDYDELGRISQLQSGIIQNLTYGYDNVGNINLINDSINSKTYTMNYDGLNRLVGAVIDNFALGNNLTFNYIYNSIGNALSITTNDEIINFTYDNLAHAPSSVRFEFNTCTTITASGTIYTLNENLSTGETCIIVNADNVIIDGQGYSIFYAQSIPGNAIYSSGYDNLTIKNLNIINNRTDSVNSTGIYFENGINLNIINLTMNISGRNTLPDSNNYAIHVNNFSRNILINNLFINTSNRGGRGIYMDGDYEISNITISNIVINTYKQRSRGIFIDGLVGLVNNITVYNLIINTFGTDSEGITIGGSLFSKSYGGSTNMSNFNINTDSNSNSCGVLLEQIKEDSFMTNGIVSTNYGDICITGSISYVKDYFFTNVSYEDETVSNGNLFRRWYYKAYVNDTNGNDIQDANVTAYNVSNTYQFNLTTDSNGFTPMTTIIDYINYGGTKDYYSLYNLYASHTSYSTINHSRNVSDLTNIYLDVFTFTASSLPDDAYKFYIRDASGNNVSWFGSEGNIVLKGSCFAQSTCTTNDGSSFIIGNSTDSTTAFINSTGDLCIEQGDCSDLSASCNPSSDAFIIRNSSSSNVAYIDYNGDLCLTGGLYENSNL